MSKPISPCYDRKRGMDCPYRQIGCRINCAKWQVYEKAMLAYREEQEKRQRLQESSFEYYKKVKQRNIRRSHYGR